MYVYVYKYMHMYLQNYANAYVSVIVSSQSSAIAGVSIHQICGLRQKVHLIISAADALAADPIHHSSERPQRVRDLEPGTARELQDVAANANLRTLRNLSCPIECPWPLCLRYFMISHIFRNYSDVNL